MPSSELNPLVPEAHYSEHQDKQVSVKIKLIKATLQLNCGFLFFVPWTLMGHIHTFF